MESKSEAAVLVSWISKISTFTPLESPAAGSEGTRVFLFQRTGGLMPRMTLSVRK
jgi:hypothetical protein